MDHCNSSRNPSSFLCGWDHKQHATKLSVVWWVRLQSRGKQICPQTYLKEMIVWLEYGGKGHCAFGDL